MSTTKIIQYTHRPNATEIGLGNTHETYMLISADTDLTQLFPPSIDVRVKDTLSGKSYYFKASDGREFRVNQMGELYRDYNVLPGDEIVITKIERGDSYDISVTVKHYKRVVLNVSNKGAELVNTERLEPYSVGSNMFEVKYLDRGIQNTLNIKFREALNKRNDSPTTTDFYDATINGVKLANGTYYLTLGATTSLSMLPKCEYNVITINDELVSNYQPQRAVLESKETGRFTTFLTALRTKPFMLLAGISGTGKSRIVRKLAQATTTQAYENNEDRWKDNRPENFELIQVKPNWHNSMDVVGFYSNISKKYEFTPFVEFIVKAWQDTGTPYFLCLDEMNLAPVEEYFAEFLSAIESRTTDKDGNYVTDPIIKPFKEFDSEADKEKVSDQMIAHLIGSLDSENKRKLAEQFRNVGLTLPPNLMVMGTVNMDETTFSFSRKVLDRAMSVEMNEVDYDSFLSGESDQFPLLTNLNEWLVNRPQQASEVKDKIDSEKAITYLKAVNGLMEGTPFKLGYRAANEALLYVAASQTLGGESFSLEKAMDEFTLMKILSRIEGDDNRLALDENDPRIAAIGADTITDTGENRINLLNSLRAIVRQHIGTETATEKKINSMYRTLEREHFVSYWA